MSSLFPNVEKYSEDSLFVELKNEFDTNKKMVRNQKFIDNMMKKGFLKCVFFPFNLLMAFFTAQSFSLKILKWFFLVIILSLSMIEFGESPWWFAPTIILIFMLNGISMTIGFDVLSYLKPTMYLYNHESFKNIIHTKFLCKKLTKQQMEKLKKELNDEYSFKSTMNENCEILYIVAMKALHEKYKKEHQPPKTPKELEKEEKKKELEKMKSNIYQKL